ncbi:GDSL esterase/lipase At1g54790-like [Ziziphus jujuba]|uniref:GDSL esterase/lipase At1g54790-like n=1 Tax=Ziziphus jujuba TaxID=326968 RepID=A0A6P3ZBL3_ZIZJJ|nr:GDSL esterase/lipase At1g54790-like [Ziziphus jujuba]XP_060667746.1 GDSL esterase/lipase At1g54790-like [Ziziphus jujuba]
MVSKTLLIQIIIFSSILLPLSSSRDYNYPAVFNFGDSNSDTGGLVAGIGFHLDPPNGHLYFKTPSGRLSDGRLIVDFLMEAMDLPFLNPYLDSIGMPSFRKGCNFAAGGSTILPAAVAASCPFTFGVQVDQFIRFKTRVLELLAKDTNIDKHLPTESSFQKGLYIIDIGQNDLTLAFYTKTLDEILAWIPTILLEVETGIKTLYDQGARNFWIHNTGPQGCYPGILSTFGTDPSKLDELACVSSNNEAAKVFNLRLHALCKKSQDQYADANIIYVDIFTIKSNLIANYSQYGFKNPKLACCGYGGPPFNFDRQIMCGQTQIINGTSVTAKACSSSTEYISWDGVHFTEAANQYVASQILTGKYSDPPFSDKMPSHLKF